MVAAYKTLSIRKNGPVDWLTLDRPEALNTLTIDMVEELGRYFSALESDSSVRVVVLRGAGGQFCAGLDLKDMGPRLASMDSAAMYAFQRRLSRIVLAMRRCPQPIIALLEGAACGGGLALALASDVRYCTGDVRMNAAFIRIGLTGCDMGASYLMQRLVGASVAAEVLMTGRFLSAERAQALGLISLVVAASELEAAAESLAADLLRAEPLALALTKQALNANLAAPSLEAALEMEDRQQTLMASGPEFAARIRAFLSRGEQTRD
jgi:enoyl-CoA hydratase/carnithine racemase